MRRNGVEPKEEKLFFSSLADKIYGFFKDFRRPNVNNEKYQSGTRKPLIVDNLDVWLDNI